MFMRATYRDTNNSKSYSRIDTWNSTIQRQTRRKIEFGTFYAGGKLDRVTYATAVFGYAKELDLSYSDEELSEKLAEHFEKRIRYAFTGQQVKSKSTLFKILTDYDNDDRKAQNRKIHIVSKIKANQNLMRVRTNLGIVRIPEKIIKRRKVNRDDRGNNDKMIQQSHEELDVLNIPVGAKQSTSQSEN